MTRPRPSEVSSARIDRAASLPSRPPVGNLLEKAEVFTASATAITPEMARGAALTVCCVALRTGAGKAAVRRALDVLGLMPDRGKRRVPP